MREPGREPGAVPGHRVSAAPGESTHRSRAGDRPRPPTGAAPWIGGLVAVALVAAACGGAGEVTSGASTTPPPGTGLTAPAVVGSAGGVVVAGDGGLSVGIPPGALVEDTEITIVAREPESPDVLVDYELGPEGLRFDEPVEITVRLPGLPDGVSPGDLEVEHVSAGTTERPTDVGPTADGDGLRFTVEHFSRIVVRLPPSVVEPDAVLEGRSVESLYDGPDGHITVEVTVSYHLARWAVAFRYNQTFNAPDPYINRGFGGSGPMPVGDDGTATGVITVDGECTFGPYTFPYGGRQVPVEVHGPAGESPRVGDVVEVVLNPAGGTIWAQDEPEGSSCPILDDTVRLSVRMTDLSPRDAGDEDLGDIGVEPLDDPEGSSG